MVKVVIMMNNTEIIVIVQKIGKFPELQKIKNNIKEFEKIIERKN